MCTARPSGPHQRFEKLHALRLRVALHAVSALAQVSLDSAEQVCANVVVRDSWGDKKRTAQIVAEKTTHAAPLRTLGVDSRGRRQCHDVLSARRQQRHQHLSRGFKSLTPRGVHMQPLRRSINAVCHRDESWASPQGRDACGDRRTCRACGGTVFMLQWQHLLVV